MHLSNKNQVQAVSVYYVGNGVVAAAILLLGITAVLLAWFLSRGPGEFVDLFLEWRRNYVETFVYAVGAAIAVMCIGWGLWTPLRLFFPSRFEGHLRQCSVQESAVGKRTIFIELGDQTIKGTYTRALMDALQMVDAGTVLRITRGPHCFIIRIEVLKADGVAEGHVGA